MNIVEVDHVVQEFKIVIRSLGGVSPETIKTVLQSRYEVIDSVLVDETTYVRKP